MRTVKKTRQPDESKRAARPWPAPTQHPGESESQGVRHHLRRALGNQAVQRLLEARVIQPKLTVNAPDDKYEREADRVADAVMRMPEPTASVVNTEEAEGVDRIQRMCPRCQRRHRQGEPLNCPECEEKLQRREASSKAPAVDGEAERQIQSLRGGGQPLPEAVRSFFEPRFGRNFAEVRVHTGKRAATSAAEVNARAFAVGRDIVFGRGEYAPDSTAGRRLVAHELVHVVQQQGASRGGRGALVQRDPQAGETAEPLTDEERNWLYQRIEHRLGTAFTKFATACERHRTELRSIASEQEEAASLVLDVVLTIATPGIGRLVRAGISGAVRSGASLTAYRLAIGALDRSDEIVSAAGSVAKHAAKRGFQSVLSRSPEEEFVDALMQEMSVGLDRLHDSLPQKSDEELSIIYANYDPEIATLSHYVGEVGRLIALYRSEVAPIGQRTGGAYGPMKARWIEGSVWKALALTGEGRYYNVGRRPQFITWISPDMRSLAVRATEAINRDGIDSVHYQDINRTGTDGERAFAMLDSEHAFLHRCGMVVERSSGVSPRRGAACPGCHGEVAPTTPPGPEFQDYDFQAWELFREGEQDLIEAEDARLLREWLERTEQE